MASFRGVFRRCDSCKVGVSVARLAAFAVLFPVLLQQAALAQETAAEESEPLEEVVTIAPRTLRLMRVEIRRAEENVIDLFNAVNTDGEYELRCRREAPLGSHIPVRACSTRIVDRLTARASQDFVMTGFFDYPAAEIRYHEQMLRETMSRLISEDPLLHRALTEYYLLKTEYDTESEERHEDKFFVW